MGKSIDNKRAANHLAFLSGVHLHGAIPAFVENGPGGVPVMDMTFDDWFCTCDLLVPEDPDLRDTLGAVHASLSRAQVDAFRIYNELSPLNDMGRADVVYAARKIREAQWFWNRVVVGLAGNAIKAGPKKDAPKE
jgi:hypothetical protein